MSERGAACGEMSGSWRQVLLAGCCVGASAVCLIAPRVPIVLRQIVRGAGYAQAQKKVFAAGIYPDALRRIAPATSDECHVFRFGGLRALCLSD